MRDLGKLTASKIAGIKVTGRYGDGRGLYLQVSEGGRSWLLRYQLNGQCRGMGLGSLEDVSLAEARQAARKARNLLLDGQDPIEERAARKRALKEAAAKHITFKDASTRYIASHKDGWKNEKHGDQWLSTLATYAFPTIGKLSTADITTDHIIEILNPIWQTKRVTAGRVRQRIESVLNWATVKKCRTGENPARWRGHLEELFAEKIKGRQEVRNQPALDFKEMSAFMAELRGNKAISARALEFTILTASRTGEAINATWDEFDLAAGVWRVPGERMKAGREHRVPLSSRVLEILEHLPREKGSPYVFPGGRKGRPLSNMGMLQLVRGMREGVVVHGFRSSFRDWAAEATNFPSEVVEMAMAHTIKNKAEAAYRRGDVLEKRRLLMEAWANYCAAPAKGNNVAPMVRKVA